MSTPSKAKSPAASKAAGNPPSQVGAGKQPAGGSPPPAGSASSATETSTAAQPHGESGKQPAGGAPPAGPARRGPPDLHVVPAAAAVLSAELIAAIAQQEPDAGTILGARDYGTRIVLVLMSADRVWKREVVR